MRSFNTTGRCIPSRHYMVNIDEKLAQIKAMVDHGSYFVINRARQYGKTTTLGCLADVLKEEYVVVSLDFQKLSNAEFTDEKRFCLSFSKLFLRAVKNKKAEIQGLDAGIIEILQKNADARKIETLGQLFELLSELCETADRPIVLMIDEVDSASNNQIFLDFLAQLRGYYLDRDQAAAFHSVILAGVYDIKNLKLKIRPEEEHRFNSPWNTRESNEENESLLSFDDCSRDQMELAPFDIAESFDVDMSFSVQGIAGMLFEYETDHHTGMSVLEIAQSIYDYTSGYPFLVSCICKTMDTMFASGISDGFDVWSERGISEAVGKILRDRSTLFDSFSRQIDEYPEMRDMLKNILFQGSRYSYNLYNEAINLSSMFGYIKNSNGSVAVSNRIFEMWLYNLFLSEDEMKDVTYEEAQRSQNQFINNRKLQVQVEHIREKLQ